MFTEHTIHTGPVPLRVRDHGGTGRPLVLLHGAGSDLSSWDAVVPLLGAGYRVVAADFRGHGGSGAGPWSWEAVLDDLDVVVAALDLDRPAVVGHSVGGLVAARWAQRHPDCPAAASLDGHRVAGTRPDDLAVTSDADLTALSRGFTEWFESAFAQRESTLTADQAAASATARAAIAADDLASTEFLDAAAR